MNNITRNNKHIIYVVLISVVALACYMFGVFDFISSIDNKVRDLKIRFLNKEIINNEVVLVTISENELLWERKEISHLIDLISSNKPQVIGLDMLFVEGKNNRDLIKSFTYAKNIILPFLIIPEEGLSVPRNSMPYSFNKAKFVLPKKRNNSIVDNDKEISESAHDSGFINVEADSDGIIRRAQLIYQFNNIYYAAFSIKIAEGYLQLDAPAVVKKDALKELRSVSNIFDYFKMNSGGSAIINFQNPHKAFKYILANEIMRKKINPDFLKNKIILIGVDSPGVRSATPMGRLLKTEIQALIIDNIINNRFIHTGKFSDVVIVLSLQLLIIMGSVRFDRTGSHIFTLFFVFILICYVIVSSMFFRYLNIAFNDVFILFYLVIGYLFLRLFKKRGLTPTTITTII